MKRQLWKNSLVLFVVMLFSLMTGVALAETKHWFVVKDKAGACRVIEAEKVAGPFKTMEEAEKRKAKDCPEGAGQATEQLRPTQEQAEPMRRQHQQREELQQLHRRQQQTEKMKGKAQEKTGRAKATEEKVKEKTKEPVPSDKKN